MATAPGTLPQARSATSPSSDALIATAARNLEEYQRLTAEGKLGEAGQRLDALKQALEQLSGRQRPGQAQEPTPR